MTANTDHTHNWKFIPPAWAVNPTTYAALNKCGNCGLEVVTRHAYGGQGEKVWCEKCHCYVFADEKHKDNFGLVKGSHIVQSKLAD